MAAGSTLHFPTYSTTSQNFVQGKDSQSTSISSATILAETPMVFGSSGIVRDTATKITLFHPCPAWYQLTAWRLSGADCGDTVALHK